MQNYPLKTSGNNHFERLTKLPPREVPSEFPELFRKAFTLENNKNKATFQANSGNTQESGKYYITRREHQSFQDLKKAQWYLNRLIELKTKEGETDEQ